jgi:hypothetical protein
MERTVQITGSSAWFERKFLWKWISWLEQNYKNSLHYFLVIRFIILKSFRQETCHSRYCLSLGSYVRGYIYHQVVGNVPFLLCLVFPLLVRPYCGAQKIFPPGPEPALGGPALMWCTVIMLYLHMVSGKRSYLFAYEFFLNTASKTVVFKLLTSVEPLCLNLNFRRML